MFLLMNKTLFGPVVVVVEYIRLVQIFVPGLKLLNINRWRIQKQMVFENSYISMPRKGLYSN